MKIEYEYNSENDNKTVWVCGIEHNWNNGRTLRNTKPTKVNFGVYHETPVGKFFTYKKNGELAKKTVSYLTSSGSSLSIYTTEEECIKGYSDMCQNAVDFLMETRNSIDEEIEKIKQGIK